MQVLLLGLFIALYLHDASVTSVQVRADGTQRVVEALPTDTWPYLGPLSVAALVLGPKLILAALYHASCMRTRRRLGTSGGQRALRRLERFSAALPLLVLGLFVNDLAIGGLRAVRLVFQHTVLIDELIILLPTLLLVILSWWSYYPVDKRLREAVIMRDADMGKPVYPLLTRGQYVSMQARHQFGLLLLPLLAVFAWSETIVFLGPDHHALICEQAAIVLSPIGILGVFILAPLVIRYVWHTAPLAAGEVRERMLALCTMHGVRIRGLLLWRTGGGLVNAAVTGMIPQVRYILLSDGLLNQVTPRETEAVMAHEIAHIKQRHMIWMALVLIVSLAMIELILNTGIDQLLMPLIASAQADAAQTPPLIDLDNQQTRMLVTALPVFACTIAIFGWVSRRIERQADVFAARHLAMSKPPAPDELQTPQRFDGPSINTMVHALQRVAELNHAPVERKSWRHGSIAWRQNHLRSLIGKPIDDAPVDRVLWRVKLATLVGLAMLVLAYFY